MATVTSSKRHLLVTSDTYTSNGDVTVGGDLFVNGSQTTINTATLDVEDKNITLNYGGNEASSQGAGITITGSNATFVWDEANTRWSLSDGLVVSGNISASNLSGTNTGDQVIPTDFVSAANGGTFSGAVTINKNGDALNLRSTTNAQKTRITFSSDVPDDQVGFIEYTHSNGASYGSGEAFIIGGTESTSTILADGKLMYNEGIYSKPATGTAAGTRKDSNWDTAYTHSQATHAPTDAEKNVQADWNETTTTSDAFILNKPTIPAAVTDFVSKANGGTFDSSVRFDGNVVIDTNTNTKTLNISRSGNTTSQVMKIGVTDTVAEFNYIEDTSNEGNGNFGQYIFKLGGNDGETAVSALNIAKTGIAAPNLNITEWDEAYTHSQAAHAPSDAEANVKADWNATSGDAEILNKPTIPSAPDLSGYLLNTTDELVGTLTIDSGTSIGLKIEHDTFAKGLELHREHADNAASITFSNNSGETGIIYANASNKRPIWRPGGTTDNHEFFTDNYHPNADKWTTARTITIGSTGKSVDGSGNVAWTLAEIGAQAAGSYAAASHSHNIITHNSTNYIDVVDHSNHTWFRNSSNIWTFQGGSSSDNWTETFSLHLPTTDSNFNNKLMELGQRTNNGSSGGKYKGVRIVKSTGSGTVADGDLKAANISATSSLSVTGTITSQSTTVVGTTTIQSAIADPGDLLHINNQSNAAKATIKFTDQASNPTQYGRLSFGHVDTASYGSGAHFTLGSTESTTTILADGKLMYKEGIYSKPSSGTGAGTRKDSNWDTAYGWGNHASAGYLTSSSTQSKYLRSDVADTAAELITFSKGISTDGNAKFYNWRALENTAGTSNQYYRIAKITGSQSTRFIIELAGRSSSYGDGVLPAYGKLVGQLNNDNNYDLTYYNHTTNEVSVVTEIGQVDVNTTQTNIYIRVGQFAEITAIAHITDGSITTYQGNSPSTSAPIGYSQANVREVWNSSNDGSGSGMDADLLDGYHASSFIRSDASDTASGTLTFTGEARFALDGTYANSEIRLPATSDQNPRMVFYRPTGSASTSYPWRFQAGGGGSSSSFYIGTGSAANNGSESISNKFSLSSSGVLTVSGDVIAYGSPSDAKYKENVKPIENALDKVMDLEGVSFDWKENNEILDIKEDIGFIAQDVQKVIPELVRENEEGNLSLRYQGLIPVLLEAMKEQQKQIDDLKAQMSACNKRSCKCNCKN